MPILPSTKILKFTEKKMYEISQNILYAPTYIEENYMHNNIDVHETLNFESYGFR